MKKSEIYQVAMRCVIESDIPSNTKVEIVNQLALDKHTSELLENLEVKKKEGADNA